MNFCFPAHTGHPTCFWVSARWWGRHPSSNGAILSMSLRFRRLKQNTDVNFPIIYIPVFTQIIILPSKYPWRKRRWVREFVPHWLSQDLSELQCECLPRGGVQAWQLVQDVNFHGSDLTKLVGSMNKLLCSKKEVKENNLLWLHWHLWHTPEAF